MVQRMPGPSVCLWWSYEQERMAKIMRKKIQEKAQEIETQLS